MTYKKEDLICPVCKQFYFEEQDFFEICDVCGWEDDNIQRDEPDYEGGANELSQNQFREKWLKEKENKPK